MIFFHVTELMNVLQLHWWHYILCLDSDICSLIKTLEHDSILATERFEGNYMKLNEDKCHFIISDYKHEIMFADIGESEIWEKRAWKASWSYNR